MIAGGLSIAGSERLETLAERFLFAWLLDEEVGESNWQVTLALAVRFLAAATVGSGNGDPI